MKRLIAALVVALGFATLAHAVCDHRTTTCFTNVDVSGTLSTGNCTCTNTTLSPLDANVTYGVTAATVTATGLGTFARVTASSYTFTGASSVSVAPIRSRELVIDSTFNVYVSTCTNVAGCWVKVGGQ